MSGKTLASLLLAASSLTTVASAVSPPLPRGVEIQVNVSQHGFHTRPAVGVFPDGGFVVVWTNGPAFPGRQVIHARLFDSHGSAQTGEFRLIDPGSGSQFANAVAVDPGDGSFRVVWTEERSPQGPSDVFVRRFDRHAAPLEPARRVNDPSPWSRHDGVIALGPRGRFAIAWAAEVVPDPGDLNGLYINAMARVFAADGTPASGERPIGYGATGIGDDNAYAYPQGLVLWGGGSLSAVFDQFVDPSGVASYLSWNPAGGEADIHFLPTQSNCCSSGQPGGAVAKAADGSLFVLWPEYGLMARRFTAYGTPLGGAFVASQRTVGDQVQPALVTLPAGGFVAVWTETAGRDGDGFGIFGRAFGAGATPLSRDFRVNLTTAGDQQFPRVAVGATGPVVVVWEGQTADGRENVYARLLTP